MPLIFFAFAATGALWNPAMLSTHPRTRPYIARSGGAASTPAADAKEEEDDDEPWDARGRGGDI